MKKVILASIVCLLVIVGISCKKVVKTVFPGIDVPLADVTLQVPAPPIPVPSGTEADLPSITQKFNLDSIVRVNTGGVFTVSDIASVKVKEFKLTVQNPDQLNNLQNFEWVRLGISSNTNSTVTNVTTVNFPDTYATTVTHSPVNSPDILSYAKGSEIYYNTRVRIRRATTKTLTVVVSTVVRVE